MVSHCIKQHNHPYHSQNRFDFVLSYYILESTRKTSIKRALIQSNDQRDPELVVPTKIGLKYKIGKIIGDGNFAVVRQCMDR